MAKMSTYIAGCNHKPGASARLLILPNGQHLELKREPENKFDKNAAAVYHGGLHLGYVPAVDSPAVAKVMDSGLIATAVLMKLIASTGMLIRWNSGENDNG